MNNKQKEITKDDFAFVTVETDGDKIIDIEVHKIKPIERLRSKKK